MQKAADDLRKQQEEAAEEKTKAIDARVPKLDVDGLDTSARIGLRIIIHDLLFLPISTIESGVS